MLIKSLFLYSTIMFLYTDKGSKCFYRILQFSIDELLTKY